MEPLDSLRGTTAIGITAFEGDSAAREAGDAAAAVLESLPVLVGLPEPVPAPAPVPGAPLAPAAQPPAPPERSR